MADDGINPDGRAQRDRMRRVPRGGRVVAPPPPLRGMRPHRLLRQLAQPARQQARQRTDHPIVRSFEPGEDWFWDYTTNQYYDGPELAAPEHHPLDQPTPGPAGRVPANWQSQLH